MAIDPKVKHTISNMKTPQRKILKLAYSDKPKYISSVLASGASGVSNSMAGRMATFSRIEEKDGTKLLEKRYNEKEGKPEWRHNQKASSDWDSVRRLIGDLLKIDENDY